MMIVRESVLNLSPGNVFAKVFGTTHAASLRARRRLQTARIDVKVRKDVAKTMERRSVFSGFKKKNGRKSTV